MTSTKRFFATAASVTGLVACAQLLDLEGSVSYAPDESVVIPSCAKAKNRLSCEEKPIPANWLNADRAKLPDGGDRCTQKVTEAPAGAGLLISSDPSVPKAPEVDGWCGVAYFTYKEGGFRARLTFRIQAEPSRERFGVFGFFLTNLSFLVVEVFEGNLRARPSNQDGPIPFAAPELGTIAPLDDAWHELALHITADGRMNVVFDGKLRASPLELGGLIPGLIQVAVLDSARAEVRASVTLDDFVAVPY